MASAVPTVSTVIRDAVDADTPQLLAFARTFLDATVYGSWLRLVPDQVATLIEVVRACGVILVAARGDTLVGFLAIMRAPCPVSGDWYAEGVAWFVEAQARRGGIALRLLDAAERWTVTQGLPRLTMRALVGSGLSPLYTRRGYVPLELVHVKRF